MPHEKPWLSDDELEAALFAEQPPAAAWVFEYEVTDKPGSMLRMVAPGCSLAEATHALRLRFGNRLVRVSHGRT